MMLRRQIYLTDNQIVALKKISKEIGISVSECIRRVIDYHIRNRGKNLPNGFDEIL